MKHVSARLALLATCVGTVLAIAGSAAPAVPNGPSPDLVISQIYGGGGNSGATYSHDYIELFNRGSASVSLDGKSLQYASATGSGNLGANAGQLTELSGSIAPGRYLLVREATNNAAVGAPLPTPYLDDPTPINMSGTAGKVALANGVTTLGCNTAETCAANGNDTRIIDLIGYGGATYFEGAPAPGLSNITGRLPRRRRLPGLGLQRSGLHGHDSEPADRRHADAFLLHGRIAVRRGHDSSERRDRGADELERHSHLQRAGHGRHGRLRTRVHDERQRCADRHSRRAVDDLRPRSAERLAAERDVHGDGRVDGDRRRRRGRPARQHGRPTTHSASRRRASRCGSTRSRAQRICRPTTETSSRRCPGVVTAVASNGFWFQDPQPDGDVATSEGIFVFTELGAGRGRGRLGHRQRPRAGVPARLHPELPADQQRIREPDDDRDRHANRRLGGARAGDPADRPRPRWSRAARAGDRGRLVRQRRGRATRSILLRTGSTSTRASRGWRSRSTTRSPSGRRTTSARSRSSATGDSWPACARREAASSSGRTTSTRSASSSTTCSAPRRTSTSATASPPPCAPWSTTTSATSSSSFRTCSRRSTAGSRGR